MKKKEAPLIQTITKNRKAHMRFAVLEAFEAGIVLHGYEVKSLRAGRVSIEEGLVRADRGELFLMNVHIPPYSHVSHMDVDPLRTRKLLMHAKEIDRLSSEVQVKGLALIPLELYFKNGMAKVTVGLAKGKKSEDRREEIKKREADREISRAR
jgi:SsrA-binding protein